MKIKMQKQKGFTLIELCVIIAILGIIAAIVIPVIAGSTNDSKSITNQYLYGLNGLTEVRCVSGYKFIVSQRGFITQVIDSQGHGVACN